MALSRPTGVTILAVLQLITSILSVIAGITALVAREAISEQLGSGSTASPELAAGLPVGLGWFFLLIGAFGLVLAWGLFTLKGWAWLITLIFQGLNILSHLASLSSGKAGGAVLGIVIAGVIIYYLLRPDVKRAFGKS